ncbi:hypothetical protein [Paraburkholderia hiiakae]|uniref:hypothetical protein n=1 Tax=Paraburkholderia hiiakae TaxID=1081782 RepID=UPI00191848F9|nr:hypothetical protein [Paraburkholderia hiiakae]
MTEREEYDAWFVREFGRADVPDAVRAVGFFFWAAGRASLIAASGVPVEIHALQERG